MGAECSAWYDLYLSLCGRTFFVRCFIPKSLKEMIKTKVLPVFTLLSQMQSAEGQRIRASQSNPSQHYLLDFSILWEPGSTSSCVLGPNLIRPQLSKKFRAGILPSLQGKTANSIFPGLNSLTELLEAQVPASDTCFQHTLLKYIAIEYLGGVPSP